MTGITLDLANSIIKESLAYAVQNKLEPLSVAVLDAGGHLVAFQKQDGSSMLRFEIAFGKAYGALAVGFGSRWLDEASADRPHFVAGLNSVSGGRIVPAPGSVLVKNANGGLLGAVGITGDRSDNDEATAVAAIGSLDLTAVCD